MLISLHVCRVDVDADGLPDQIDRQHEASARRVLAHEPPDDASERTMHHFHERPLANQRTRIVLQLARDEHANAVELVFGNRRRPALDRDDVHDPGAFQDRQSLVGIEPREAIAGEQRPIDLLFAVFPPTPARDCRQKRFNLLAFELLADDLLVAGPRPDGEPLKGGRNLGFGVWDSIWFGAPESRIRNPESHPTHFVTPLARAAIPSSYAFFTSGFFQSMIASARSFSRYLRNSACRLSVNTRSPICSRACSKGSVCAPVEDSSLRIW